MSRLVVFAGAALLTATFGYDYARAFAVPGEVRKAIGASYADTMAIPREGTGTERLPRALLSLSRKKKELAARGVDLTFGYTVNREATLIHADARVQTVILKYVGQPEIVVPMDFRLDRTL